MIGYIEVLCGSMRQSYWVYQNFALKSNIHTAGLNHFICEKVPFGWVTSCEADSRFFSNDGQAIFCVLYTVVIYRRMQAHTDVRCNVKEFCN